MLQTRVSKEYCGYCGELQLEERTVCPKARWTYFTGHYWIGWQVIQHWPSRCSPQSQPEPPSD